MEEEKKPSIKKTLYLFFGGVILIIAFMRMGSLTDWSTAEMAGKNAAVLVMIVIGLLLVYFGFRKK